MTFEEFNDIYGKYHAYQDWTTVQFAKSIGRIPEKFAVYFDDLCECGSENVISRTLTREMCIDPKCPVKVGYQLAEMFSRCGIKGLGYATCSNIYKQMLDLDRHEKKEGGDGLFVYRVYTEVLVIPWEKYPSNVRSTVKGTEFFQACLFIRSKSFTFSQMVASLGLAELGENSERVFGGFNSFGEWCDAVKSAGGMTAFCASRGVYSPDIVLSVALATEAIGVADFALRDSLRAVGLTQISVCMTGSASIDGRKYTKKEFVDACNELCIDSNGVRLIELKNTSGPATVPFVLYSIPTATHKFVTGQSRGVVSDEFGEHKVLMSTDDFYNLLKGAMAEWNRRLEQGLDSEMSFCQVMKEVQMMMKTLSAF